MFKEEKQTNVVDFIEQHIIYQFELPKTIMKYHRTIFLNKQVKEYAKSHGVKMLNSIPYHVLNNGQVKDTNKVIINLIKKHV